MGKLQDKRTLTTKPASEIVLTPLAGWTWYCGYHDTAGQGDDFEEVQFMAGVTLPITRKCTTSMMYASSTIVNTKKGRKHDYTSSKCHSHLCLLQRRD